MAEQHDPAEEVRLWQRRLQKLREQKALFGATADPSLAIQIEDIEATIAKLQAGPAGHAPAQRRPALALPAFSVAEPGPELARLRAEARIFLCHAGEDKAPARQLYHLLKEAGYRPWLDKFDLLPGQRWRPVIQQIITDPRNLVLVCLSTNSLTKQGVIQQEIKWAVDIVKQMPEEAIHLIPVRLEVCRAPEEVAEFHWVDLFEPDSFEYLSRALDYELARRQERAAAEAPPPAPAAATASRAAKAGSEKEAAPPQPFEPELILIPAGEFLMGSDPQQDNAAQAYEQPQHKLYLADYYIGKYPVTNAQYAAFVQATGHRKPGHWKKGQIPTEKENHPVVEVSWDDATAYCQWLAKVTGRAYRLPSEAEWEKAARGPDGRIFPWGNTWEAGRCNSRENGPAGTTPVGAYPQGASPYGVLDMAGNVWEWTSSLLGKDWKKPAFGYPYNGQDGRENLKAGTDVLRVLRGGSWSVVQDFVRCAARGRSDPSVRSGEIGFRLLLAPI